MTRPRRGDAPRGTVYLLHFSAPYRHAQHYIGFAADLPARLAQHEAGTGARLLQVVAECGITWTIARTWERATRTDERRLKNRGGASRLCPICRAQLELRLDHTSRRPTAAERRRFEAHAPTPGEYSAMEYSAAA